MAASGVVALGAGGVMALFARSANEDSKSGCDSRNRCQPDASTIEIAPCRLQTRPRCCRSGGALAIAGGAL